MASQYEILVQCELENYRIAVYTQPWLISYIPTDQNLLRHNFRYEFPTRCKGQPMVRSAFPISIIGLS